MKWSDNSRYDSAGSYGGREVGQKIGQGRWNGSEREQEAKERRNSGQVAGAVAGEHDRKTDVRVCPRCAAQEVSEVGD